MSTQYHFSGEGNTSECLSLLVLIKIK
uniref:Uncharacterized protein n=1 Tax=Anguilla anguilla TaxID=7936 RepID=A0A0E9R6N3_ANGAN